MLIGPKDRIPLFDADDFREWIVGGELTFPDRRLTIFVDPADMPLPVLVRFVFPFQHGNHLLALGEKLFDRQQDFFDLIIQNGIGLDQQVES